MERATLSIPDHDLLKQIGEGSYGEVWLARNVMGTFRAVKVVYRDRFESDRPYEREYSGIQKFEPISRTHEGLVDVLHIGRNDRDGYFFYVMELADDALGREMGDGSVYEPKTLSSEVQRQKRLPIGQCLELGITLGGALEHLHVGGLVHRDIKPSNIIFVNGTAKLADIGLVASFSAAFSFVGTEGFIPPEGPGSVQADIYSLGKVLYECATGKDRHDFPALPTLLGTAEEQSSLLELNEVILKACARDTGKRYSQAGKMREELEMLRSGLSLSRVRTLENRLVWLSRVGVVLLVLTVAVGIGYWIQSGKTRIERESRQKVESANRQAQDAFASLGFERVSSLFKEERTGEALAHLAQTLRQSPQDRVSANRAISALTHRSFMLPVRLDDSRLDLSAVCLSSTNQRLSLSRRTNELFEVVIVDQQTKQQVAPPLQHKQEVTSAKFSPDGSRLVTGCADQKLRLWDTYSGRMLWESRPLPDGVQGSLYGWFNDDGRVVMAAIYADGDVRYNRVRLLDAIDGKELSPILDMRLCRSFRLTFDKRFLLLCFNDYSVQVVETASGKPIGAPFQHNDVRLGVNPVSTFADIARDGARVVTAGEDGMLKLWDIGTGKLDSAPIQGSGPLTHAFFTSSDTRIVSLQDSGQRAFVRLWDAHTGSSVAEPLEFRRIPDKNHRIIPSPDGRFCFLALQNTSQGIYESPFGVADLQAGEIFDLPVGCGDRTSPMPLTSHDWKLFSFMMGSTAVTYRLSDGRKISSHVPNVRATPEAFSLEEDLVACCENARWVTVVETTTGRVRLGPVPGAQECYILDNGTKLLTWDKHKGHRLYLWDLKGINQTNSPLLDCPLPSEFTGFALSEDQSRLAVGSSNDGVRIWDLHATNLAQPLMSAHGLGPGIWPSSFSLDGKQIGCLNAQGKVFLLDAKTGQLKQSWKPEVDTFSSTNGWSYSKVAFGPDGKSVAVVDSGTFHLWNCSSGTRESLLRLTRVRDFKLSPCGRFLWVKKQDDRREVYDLRSTHVTQPNLVLDTEGQEHFLPNSSNLLRLYTQPDGSGRGMGKTSGNPLGVRSEIVDILTGRPLSEDMGLCLPSAVQDGTARVFRINLETAELSLRSCILVTNDCPAWFPDLVEAVGGCSLDARGRSAPVPWDARLGILDKCRQIKGTDEYSRWVKWFLADRATRTISPQDTMTVPQYIDRCIEDNTTASLRRAVSLSPTNQVALAKLKALEKSGTAIP